MATLFQQAIDLAKKGDRAEAERLLRQVLAQQPNNEAAWMWLSAVTGDVLIKQEALQRVLKINPVHPLAKKGVARFGGGKTPPPAELPSAPPDAFAPPPLAEAGFDDSAAGVPALAWDVSDNAPSPQPPATAPEVAALDFDFNFGPATPPAVTTPPVFPPAPAPGADTPLTPVPDFDFFDIEPAAPTTPALTTAPTFTEEPALSEPSPFDLMFAPAEATPPAPAPKEPSLFSDLMGGGVATSPAPADPIPGGFNLDEPPIFDIDLGQLSAKPAAPVNSWDEPPAFSFDGSMDEGPVPVPALIEDTISDDFFATPKESIASDELEEMLAQTGEKPLPETDDTPPFLTEPEAAIDLEKPVEKPVEMTPEQLRAQTLRRKNRQNQMLIAFTILFSLATFLCCGLYYYLYEMTDTYTLIPALAGAQITEKAGQPDEKGAAVLKFRGYPASRMTVTWSPNPQAKTCTGDTGLNVDYAGQSSALNNSRFCSGEKCNFEKEITPPAAISTITITYKCAKNVAVTLYK